MNRAFYGRIVFGAAAVLFGVIALMWHDAATWQTLRQIWRVPFGMVIGGCLMAAQIAAGIAMQYPRTARLAAVILAIVYLCFSLACIPDMVAASSTYERYGGSCFQYFCLVCGAVALYAATEANAARALRFGRGARLGLGVCAISFALGQLLYLRDTASLVPKWIPPNPMFWAIATTIAFAVAAVALLVNRQARLATRLMTLMLALFAPKQRLPRTEHDGELVTIQSFSHMSDAMLARAMLESPGIACFLADDNTGRILGLPEVIGGIRLQVNSKDVEAAATVLGQPDSDTLDMSAEDEE